MLDNRLRFKPHLLTDVICSLTDDQRKWVAVESIQLIEKEVGKIIGFHRGADDVLFIDDMTVLTIGESQFSKESHFHEILTPTL